MVYLNIQIIIWIYNVTPMSNNELVNWKKIYYRQMFTCTKWWQYALYDCSSQKRLKTCHELDFQRHMSWSFCCAQWVREKCFYYFVLTKIDLQSYKCILQYDNGIYIDTYIIIFSEIIQHYFEYALHSAKVPTKFHGRLTQQIQ